MKKKTGFLSALLGLLLFASVASASAILTTRPTFDKQYKPEGIELRDCARGPQVLTFYLWDDMAGATYTWTGNDEPTLWLWGPQGDDSIAGIVIRRGTSYFAIDQEELLSTAAGSCDLP